MSTEKAVHDHDHKSFCRGIAVASRQKAECSSQRDICLLLSAFRFLAKVNPLHDPFRELVVVVDVELVVDGFFRDNLKGSRLE